MGEMKKWRNERAMGPARRKQSINSISLIINEMSELMWLIEGWAERNWLVVVDWWVCFRGYGRCSANGSAERKRTSTNTTNNSWMNEVKQLNLNGSQSIYLIDGMNWVGFTEWRGPPPKEQRSKSINQLTSQKGREVKVDLNWLWSELPFLFH